MKIFGILLATIACLCLIEALLNYRKVKTWQDVIAFVSLIITGAVSFYLAVTV